MTRTKGNYSSKSRGTLFILSAGIAALLLTLASFPQSPTPSPSGETEDRYSVKASTEIGGRWVDVNGNENKFRSDLNYRSGFRLFDSSILLEDNGSGGKAFDSALFMASGWGADPSGMFRANMERDGIYRFDASVRRVSLFNNLNNHAVGATLINYHNYDTHRNFGDFDLTLLPDNRKIRFRVGGSYNLRSGDFTYTSRQSDAFPILADADQKAYDFRAGADGQFLGFNFSGTYGYRSFSDRTTYRLVAPDEGDVINTTDIDQMERENPIDGKTHFGIFSVQRTFAKKLDFTAKIMHSRTTSDFSWNEFIVYRSPALNRTEYNITGDSNRPQTRGDLGITWRVTDKFRISNTYTYDGFNINGGNLYAQLNAITLALTESSNYLTTRYRRNMNLIEADYQFSPRFAVNAGYRYSDREVRLYWIGLNAVGVPNSGHPIIHDVENTTHTFIAGTRIKPMKNWSIYADLERGQADTVFTRAGNADFTNFRIRSLMRFDKVSASVSFIDKENEFPTDTITATTPRITDISNRTFSATIDWNPIDQFNLAGGYNYVHLTSRATVDFSSLVNVLSEYFVRDNYFFVDATVRPHKRFTFFGSYRWNKDRGHGDRQIPITGAQYILGSYPFDFKTPELRASVRLNKYIDWNVGYQYYDYKEEPIQNIQWGLPFQNYSAHMPYTSVRIYLGRGAGDR